MHIYFFCSILALQSHDWQVFSYTPHYGDLPPKNWSSYNVSLRTRKGAGQSEGNIFLEMLPYVL